MTITPRTLAAALLALALAAAGCSGGGTAETAAPDTAPPETTAAPATTTDTTAPAPTTTEDPCAEAEAETAEGRALLDQAEAAGAPPTAEQVEEIAEARWGALFDRRLGCEDIWNDDDEARLDKLAARVGEESPAADPEAEAGDQPANENGAGADDPDAETTTEPPADDGQADGEPPAPTTTPAGPAPDDPEWVDTPPTAPPLPDAGQPAAGMVLPQSDLLPIAAVEPYVCEHQPWWCGGEAERWAWAPVRLTVGAWWLVPSTGEIAGRQEVPPGSGDYRVTFDADYTYTVAGFAPASEPAAGGILDISVLVAEKVASKWGWRYANGWTWDCAPAGSGGDPDEECGISRRDIAIRALVLPEHADRIARDGDTVTAATVLLLWAVPLGAGES